MPKILFVLAIALVLMVLSLGCDNSNETIVGPSVDSINTVINIEIFENRRTGLTNLELRCQTDSIYNCINYLIDFGYSQSADTLKLVFNEITEPNICLTALGPATAIIDLGSLLNIGHEFSLEVNGITIPTQLILTDSTIEIIGGDSTWTNIVRSVLYRVPTNKIWGEVGFSDPVLRDSALTFFDSLTSLGATPDSLPAGHYGYFYIDSAGVIDSILELGPSIGTDSIYSFIYDYTYDSTALDNLVQAYQNQAGNLIKLNVNTSNGYQFKSY